jgi:hypothetical protein
MPTTTPVAVNRNELRLAVLRGLAVAPASIDDYVVERLVARTLARKPENPVGYAHIAGRNYAISQVRSADAKRRAEVRRVEAEERAARAKAHAEECAKELRGIIATLVEGTTDIQFCHLDVVVRAYADGAKDEDIAKQYPKTTRDQRYQWKTRGLRRVLPLASEKLRAFMGYGG